ncbi:hypothetical protein PIB30_075916 [Stylosanthes scabra]|uniref:Secreted protein n=1 Tax=Stylosanthes scabra TaxID=79078 RepID=A0ABU6YQF0_9FABA|nr:hypothetical protein [Stylosanthes scabra]
MSLSVIHRPPPLLCTALYLSSTHLRHASLLLRLLFSLLTPVEENRLCKTISDGVSSSLHGGLVNPLYTRHCPPSFWLLVIHASKNRDSKTPSFSFIPKFRTVFQDPCPCFQNLPLIVNLSLNHCVRASLCILWFTTRFVYCF